MQIRSNNAELLTLIFRMSKIINLLLPVVIYLTVIPNARSTLTPKSLKSKKSEILPEKLKIGPQSYSIFDEQLINDNPSYKEILINYQAYYKNVNTFNTPGIVLGYVTPVGKEIYSSRMVLKYYVPVE